MRSATACAVASAASRSRPAGQRPRSSRRGIPLTREAKPLQRLAAVPPEPAGTAAATASRSSAPTGIATGVRTRAGVSTGSERSEIGSRVVDGARRDGR